MIINTGFHCQSQDHDKEICLHVNQEDIWRYNGPFLLSHPKIVDDSHMKWTVETNMLLDSAIPNKDNSHCFVDDYKVSGTYERINEPQKAKKFYDIFL